MTGLAHAAAAAINSEPPSKCWADAYMANGQPNGESCNHIVKGCQIGLCEACATALCAGSCRCPKKAVAA